MPNKSRHSFAPARKVSMARIAGAMLMTLAASGAISSSAHAAGKTLVFCSEGSPAGFDSAQYTTSTDFDAGAHAVYDTLVEFKRGSLDLVPGLAEKWDESADAKLAYRKKNVSLR